jgi:hypothetical protein
MGLHGLLQDSFIFLTYLLGPDSVTAIGVLSELHSKDIFEGNFYLDFMFLFYMYYFLKRNG